MFKFMNFFYLLFKMICSNLVKKQKYFHLKNNVPNFKKFNAYHKHTAPIIL